MLPRKEIRRMTPRRLAPSDILSHPFPFDNIVRQNLLLERRKKLWRGVHGDIFLGFLLSYNTL